MSSDYLQIFLASRSPRRSELLRQLAIRFQTVPVDVSEVPEAGESAEAFTRRIALAKAHAGLQATQGDIMRRPVLGADTVVVLDERIIGKPRDSGDAARMLQRLSGRMHQVMSAVALVDGDSEQVVSSLSTVWFSQIPAQRIEDYIDTGEPLDKAGAYAIQGRGAAFVQRLEGSYSGVMGLPLFETAALLERAGIRGF